MLEYLHDGGMVHSQGEHGYNGWEAEDPEMAFSMDHDAALGPSNFVGGTQLKKNGSGCPNQETAAGGHPALEKQKSLRKKARRACFTCQRTHVTCGKFLFQPCSSADND
jgi:hypothetical protein